MMKTQELIEKFIKTYPDIVKQMREADHAYDSDNQNPYHLEGDVFTHTMMVMKEADRNNLPYPLKVACLLHDIGKPFVRDTSEFPKTKFYNHESVSAFTALSLMDDLGLNKIEKEYVFKIICLHTEPYKRKLMDLQEDICNIGLYYNLLQVSEADKNGRFYTKGDLELDFTVTYFPKPERQNPREVVLMVGVPYSGKSTYIAEQMKLNPNCIVISRDALIDKLEGTNYNDKWKRANQNEIDAKLKEKLKEANKNKSVSKVFVDMTHMSKKSRRKTLGYFGTDWDKSCVVMLPNITTIQNRTQVRKDKFIDESVIERMMMNFYPPLHGEGFYKIDYIME